MHLDVLSHVDQQAVCDQLQTRLGKLPSIALTRQLSNAVYAMHIKGSKDAAAEIAYQMINIAEVRDQLSDDEAFISTLDTVFKIYNGSGGHVTPKDLDVFLRSAGPSARTMTDDSLIFMSAVIQEEKKSRGE